MVEWIKTLKMLLFLFFIKTWFVVTVKGHDPASEQLLRFKESTNGSIGTLTTSSGYLVNTEEASSSLNAVLIRHPFFLDSILHLSRERIPERFVHAAGAGAFGYFEVTHDITNICKAKLFSAVGKRTNIAVRFSTLAGDRGTSDTIRDIRGFAIKFYTEAGNFDIVGINSPAFSLKDPLFFPAVVHATKRNPTNNLIDLNMQWDFFTHRTDNRILLLNLYSDRGTPDGYRYLPGYSVHTYQVENNYGEPSFVRFYFIPHGGHKNLNASEATRLAGTQPDYSARDLYNAIAIGKYPIWALGIQVLTLNDVKKANFDVFDVTKILPEKEYPIQTVGKLVLDRNPVNYFSDFEQSAFCPGNLVTGILGAPDKLFEARTMVYKDSQNYRVGVNHNMIPVNRPINKPHTYNRDGRGLINDNGGCGPNYFPNSFNGPVAYCEKTKSKLIDIVQDESGNVEQARTYYKHYLTDKERDSLPNNIANDLTNVNAFLQKKVIKMFSEIDGDLGNQIAESLQKQKSE